MKILEANHFSSLLLAHLLHCRGPKSCTFFLLALSLLKAWNQPMATLTDERKQLRAPRNELGAARKELGAARKVAKGRTEYSVRLLTVSVRLSSIDQKD